MNLAAGLVVAVASATAVVYIDDSRNATDVLLATGSPTSVATSTTVQPATTAPPTTAPSPSSQAGRTRPAPVRPSSPSSVVVARPVTTVTTGVKARPGTPPALAALESVEPLRLMAPPFPGEQPDVADEGPRLIERSSSANKITDEDEWLQRNGLARPWTPPDEVDRRAPRAYRGADLVGSIGQGGETFVLYGPTAELATYVVSVDLGSDVVEAVYDFGSYVVAPSSEKGDADDLVRQGVLWVARSGDVLYVSSAHSTYARSSEGMNAYLSAIDARSGALRWRAGPLVANARTFEVVGDVIVAGYGFTDEDDFLYVIDRGSGAVLRRQQVTTAPTFIMQKGDGDLYVRCYDTDYVFRVAGAE